jgi:hypothetical protein
MAVTKVSFNPEVKPDATSWSSFLGRSSYYSAYGSSIDGFYNQFGGVVSDPVLR